MTQNVYPGLRLPATYLTDFDKHLFNEGNHERAYEKFGAHLLSVNGRDGVAFVVWAPNAKKVAVIGDFNGWNADRHVMHSSDAGIWTLFIQGLPEWSVYKYQITGADGQCFDKSDPFGFAMRHQSRLIS